MVKFIILSLPRSRSAWLASWFCHSGRNKVAHDIAARVDNVGNFFSALAQCDGSVETGAVIGWRLIKERLPKTKLVVIKRPIGEVAHSLAKFGMEGDEVLAQLSEREAMLDTVSSLPDVETLEFADLTIKACGAWLWTHCLAEPFDEAWWDECVQRNIQVNMKEQLFLLRARTSELAKFRAEVLDLQAASPCPPLN